MNFDTLVDNIITNCNVLVRNGNDIIKQKNVSSDIMTGYSSAIERLYSHLSTINNTLKQHTFDCDFKLNTIQNTIQDSKKSLFKFIEKSDTGLMVIKDYADDDEILEEEKKTTSKTLILNSLYDVSIPTTKFTSIESIDKIPQCFYFLKGDSNRKAGVYMCISPNTYIRVPFPDTKYCTDPNTKTNCIRCKHITKENCNEIRKNYIKRGGVVNACTFVHKNEKYSKIVNNYRCQDNPSFGNFKTLAEDMKNIRLKDIKTIMMYAMSDLLLVYMWFMSVPHDTLVFDNIDTFTS
jgi:hypothetical protein